VFRQYGGTYTIPNVRPHGNRLHTRVRSLVWDLGETLEDGVIAKNEWLSLHAAMGETTVWSNLYVSLAIEHPDGEGGDKKWQVRLGVTPAKL
jgi:hypothetical protein